MAREYLTGSAAQRRVCDEAGYAAYQRVAAVDLENAGWSVSGAGATSELEKTARIELAKELFEMATAVSMCSDDLRWGWREASRDAVKWREEAEAGREMLRLVLRAWREVRDGVQAGTAKWEARWEHDAAECALARRVRFSPSGDDDTAQVTQEAFFGEAAWQLRVLLAFMRLVRAGPVADARRRSPTWQRAQHERRLRALQLSWEHAMPGERSQKYSWREEAAMSEAHGVTSGAAAVRVRRAQQQQQQRQQQGRRDAPQQHTRKKARPASPPPTSQQPTASLCLPCDEGHSPGIPQEAPNSGFLNSGIPHVDTANDMDPPAHLRSRWTDALLSLTPHAHAVACRHLGIACAMLPPDARLRDAQRPRGDG